MSYHVRRRRAAILTLFIFILPVLIILLGFCIDMSYMQLIQTEMRLATDNAARAAADNFARTEDETSARNAGIEMAANFEVAGTALQLSDGDFDFGRATAGDNGAYAFDTGGFPPNAVRLLSSRDANSLDGSVPLFFSQWIGRGNYEPSSSSTAAFLNVDICLVLDRSTSMKLGVASDEQFMYISDSRFCAPPGSDTRWLALEDGVKEFVRVLEDNAVDEYVSVVTYGSDLDEVIPGLCGREQEATLDLSLTNELADVEEEVEDRSESVWNGNTVIASGMNLATSELVAGAGARQYSEKVMIVLTDGYPTAGDAVAAASNAAANAIRVYTITFGDDANQAHMQDVAAAGGGIHEHATDKQSLEAIFREFAAAATRIVE